MKKNIGILLLFSLLTCIGVSAQNFSGLQNKKLNKIDDVGSLIESGLGSLLGGGKVKGSIDSVVVLNDAERELQLKIYYTGFENATLKVQASNAEKQKQDDVKKTQMALPASRSVTCTLLLNSNFQKGKLLESPFLKIEITKDINKPGLVTNYALNKKWKVDPDPENVVFTIKPQPIGNTAALRENEVKDVTPSKMIIFDATKLYYTPKLERRTEMRSMQARPVMRTGLQTYSLFSNPDNLRKIAGLSDNISGTWTNTDAATNGITRLVITDNNKIQVFGKCSPSDCDWGNVNLADGGNNTFKAVYSFSFKTATIYLVYANNQLTLTEQNVYKDARGVKTNTYTFGKNTALASLVLTTHTSIKDYAIYRERVAAPATTDYAAKGADNKPIYLWAGLTSDNIDIERPQDISNINMNIFPDKNPASGVYYFLPADYHLRYESKEEPEKGYNLSILYGSTTAAEEAPVRMSAKLTAGISTREINFIKTLLKASIPSAKEVRILPLRENPVFSFQSYLTSQYNIPQNKIAVESSTDLSNDIRVAWQTDATTKEFIQTALTSREGLAASVILKPQSETIIDQQIPVTINLAEGRTLGKLHWTHLRGEQRNGKTQRPILCS
jgi:hypothetical protein